MSQENDLVCVNLCPDLRTGGPARKPPLFLLCNQDGKPLCEKETGSYLQAVVKSHARLKAVLLSDTVSNSYAWLLKAGKCQLTHLVSGQDHKILICSEVGRREIMTGLFAGSVFMVDKSMIVEHQPIQRDLVDFAASEIAA